MHEYKRFVQEQMDARGWRQADLVRASGLSRALVSRILRDDRPRLGQMPDESTMVGLAKAFSVSVETVRTAAARALRGYADDGDALTTDLSTVSIDALLMEIRRRVEANENQSTQDAPHDPPADGEAGPDGTPMSDELGTQADYDLAAERTVDGPSRGEYLHRQVEQAGEEDQEPDDWEGA